MASAVESKSVVKTVFFALVLDLLAFTIPLPLFPRMIAWYRTVDSLLPSPQRERSLLNRLLSSARYFRSTLLSFAVAKGSFAQKEYGAHENWDIVLLGGAMGSLFSLCQCIISPWLGRLSDKYGRKKVLLATMMGNILSAVIWIQSTSFSSLLLSRLVGGLSEGNVQLSTAIISDVTSSENRSKSLALVGIAFSICFTLGPSLGAYFASKPLPVTSNEKRYNMYALPAAVTLVLLLIETTYLYFALPETKGWKHASPPTDQVNGRGSVCEDKINGNEAHVDERLKSLKAVGRLHGLFLLFFSGAEFTLTFLTYDLFEATNAQNGKLLSYIGVLSALLQARHVRPSLARVGELKVASRGIASCIIALSLLATFPFHVISSSTLKSNVVLYGAATFLAYTSATVVTGLTAAAASYTDENTTSVADTAGIQPKVEDKKKNNTKQGDNVQDKQRQLLQRGRALGMFRSRGQLGRAIGPILASSLYWVYGPTVAYAGLAGCLGVVSIVAIGKVPAAAQEDRVKVE
ncbi:hypothetical protein I317_02801 [Kwoniella heveanensis CBS 569]|nr:hypothetical protein I317_02801 [Kwoniella heveanensis CBS 569]